MERPADSFGVGMSQVLGTCAAATGTAEEHRKSAREDLGGGELVLRTADGTEISLPSSLLRLVVSAANNLAAGRAVMAIPAEVMLTPTEAAELLGLSRPFVARLLERGDIPSELLPGSRHRRIKLGDVLAFQDRRERRSEGRGSGPPALAKGRDRRLDTSRPKRPDRSVRSDVPWLPTGLPRTCPGPSPS
jgi:excisionase family DNA binding protein